VDPLSSSLCRNSLCCNSPRNTRCASRLLSSIDIDALYWQKSMKALPVLCCGPATEPLDSDASETVAARFRALADPTRVAIVNRLASTKECCVCDLNAAFVLSQPTISHHLKVLRDAGLVESTRRGTWAYYRLVPEAVGALRQTLGG
jgi:ArsR family transcriptional regulator